MINQYKPYSLKKKGVSLKVLENQMVIFDDGLTWMYTTIIQVRESIKGVRTGKMVSTNTPVVFEKLTNTWSVSV